MPFIKFTQTGRSYRPKASIRPNGTIGFNSGAVEKFSLKSYQYALLFYDKERRVVGVRPLGSEEDGAVKLNKGSTGAWIAARRFLDFFDLSSKEKRRADATWDEQEKMIVFQA